MFQHDSNCVGVLKGKKIKMFESNLTDITIYTRKQIKLVIKVIKPIERKQLYKSAKGFMSGSEILDPLKNAYFSLK